jgi:hypothetical protein
MDAGKIDSRFYSVVVGAPPLPKEVAEIKDLDEVSLGEESSEEEDSGRPTSGKKAFEIVVKEEKKVVEAKEKKEEKKKAMDTTSEKISANEAKKKKMASDAKDKKADDDKATASAQSPLALRKNNYDKALLTASAEKLQALLEASAEKLPNVLTKSELQARLDEIEKAETLEREANVTKPRPESADDARDGISPLIQPGSSSGSIDFGLGLNVKASLVINPDLFTYDLSPTNSQSNPKRLNNAMQTLPQKEYPRQGPSLLLHLQRSRRKVLDGGPQEEKEQGC